MNYYPKTSLSQHGERPAATAVVATDGTVTWEGQPVVGTFPDGNQFTSISPITTVLLAPSKDRASTIITSSRAAKIAAACCIANGNKSCYSIYYCQ
jgi:hypothetical protein